MVGEYPSDWESRRKHVYERDDYKCQNCGRVGGEAGESNLHAHHIVPKKKGGTHKMSNLVSVCEQCHNAIHNDRTAPTKDSRAQPSDLRELLSRLEEFLKFAQAGLAIDSPGKVQNDRIEAQRVSLIQDFGKWSIDYNAPSKKHEEAMTKLISSCIGLLEYPEDAWKKTVNENLSREEAKKFARKTTEERSRGFGQAVNEIMNIGIKSFFR